MFQLARLKLTLWYLLIIMLISVVFSAAFYNSSTREVQRVIDRLQFDLELERQLASSGNWRVMPRPRDIPTIEELQGLKNRARNALLILNGVIFVFAGGAGYFLAGRTLRPIKVMVEEQQTFIANASHELRTPIATLRAEMEASLLSPKLTAQAVRALVVSNLEEVTSLQELTDRLLKLLHSPPDPEHFQSADLANLTEKALTKVRALAKQKQIVFQKNLLPVEITADAASLTEAISALLDNAIKYSPPKSIVHVLVISRGKEAILRVQDEGIGIAAQDLPHIFTRFYRADASRSKSQGYGLGLSIVKKTVTEHHGRIVVESKGLGHGTCCTIFLPKTTR